jgi:hypothetical protein
VASIKSHPLHTLVTVASYKPHKLALRSPALKAAAATSCRNRLLKNRHLMDTLQSCRQSKLQENRVNRHITCTHTAAWHRKKLVPGCTCPAPHDQPQKNTRIAAWTGRFAWCVNAATTHPVYSTVVATALAVHTPHRSQRHQRLTLQVPAARVAAANAYCSGRTGVLTFVKSRRCMLHVRLQRAGSLQQVLHTHYQNQRAITTHMTGDPLHRDM